MNKKIYFMLSALFPFYSKAAEDMEKLLDKSYSSSTILSPSAWSLALESDEIIKLSTSIFIRTSKKVSDYLDPIEIRIPKGSTSYQEAYQLEFENYIKNVVIPTVEDSVDFGTDCREQLINFLETHRAFAHRLSSRKDLKENENEEKIIMFIFK